MPEQSQLIRLHLACRVVGVEQMNCWAERQQIHAVAVGQVLIYEVNLGLGFAAGRAPVIELFQYAVPGGAGNGNAVFQHRLILADIAELISLVGFKSCRLKSDELTRDSTNYTITQFRDSSVRFKKNCSCFSLPKSQQFKAPAYVYTTLCPI